MPQECGKNTRVSLIVGVIAGLICAITKFGWEIPFPPRTPARDLVNPPQQLLQQLGFSSHFTHLTYSYGGNPRPYISFVIHFGFSIVFSVLYCVLAEFYPKIKLWQGAAYGLFLWFAFHVVLMPLMGTVPPPWQQPFTEHFSEITGHMFCFWVVELVRRDLRNRITNLPDVHSISESAA